MANLDQPKGLEPYGPCLRSRPYQAGGTIYAGDPVKLDANGQVVVSTAGAACVGVALSYATSGTDVLVADHPDQEFTAQSDDSTIDAQTDLNLCYNFVFGSANTTYRRSGVEIDGDSGDDSTATKQARVTRVLPAVNNSLGANVKVICKINNHQLNGGTGVAGV